MVIKELAIYDKGIVKHFAELKALKNMTRMQKKNY